MKDLIAKLEAATEGSGTFDRAIRDALGLSALLVPPDGGDEAHPYTTSLDAAMKLVPEDRIWSVGKIVRAPGYIAVLDNDGHSHKGSTPALALCIAALKARSQS